MKASKLIERFQSFAPEPIAESWDNVGLQLGNPDQEIHHLITTLDVRPEVVKEAVDTGADFIFAHHPVMFHPARNLDTRNPQNKMYADILKHNIVVYAAHTNLDNANGGMDDWLADQLDLKATTPLLAGGMYPNREEHYGMGRIGELDTALSLEDFVQLVKQQFELEGLRVITPDWQRNVQKVAILGGSGSQFWQDAQEAGADVYVTGDVSYHVGHDMIAGDLSVVDAGHYIERICKFELAKLFRSWAKEEDWALKITVSQLNTDPFTYL